MYDEYSSMRSAFIRVTQINHIRIDNVDLGLKAGDTLVYRKCDILQVLEEWSMNKAMKYFMIEHNEDPDNIHWHIVLKFEYPTVFDQIKNKFPYGDIERCKHGIKASVQYLVHMNNPEKHQFSWDEVITNAPAKLELYKIPKGESEIEKLNAITELIIKGEIREFEIDRIDYKLYIKFLSQLRKAFEYRQKLVALNPCRYMQVIVLEGPPRVGKSTFCKLYAERENKSICFSSSSNDPWQDYAGQDIFVYDDFDYTKIKINNLKKAFDPHNTSSVSSRYKNKLFVGDTIFVCTNTPIIDWYTWAQDVDRKALFMRISCVLKFRNIENGISHYTVNHIVDSGEWDYAKDMYGNMTQRKYRMMKLNPVDDKVHDLDLNTYLDMNADKVKTDEFISRLDDF